LRFGDDSCLLAQRADRSTSAGGHRSCCRSWPRERGESYDEAAYAEVVRGAVQDVVNRRIDVGIDIVDDGEMGKPSLIIYLYERVSGLEARVMTLEGASVMPPSRDRQQLPGADAALDALDEAAVRESPVPRTRASTGMRRPRIRRRDPSHQRRGASEAGCAAIGPARQRRR
jgi:hypothetical protein